jgi:hypothetical protein
MRVSVQDRPIVLSLFKFLRALRIILEYQGRVMIRLPYVYTFEEIYCHGIRYAN